MTIEDRVRRVLSDAVADEPPLRGAPLQAALRRRQRRPVLAGAIAVVLVLAAVVAVVTLRRPDKVLPATPTLTTLPTTGWPEVVDEAGNFRFRHPPGWETRRTSRSEWNLIPPGARPGVNQPPRFLVVVAPAGYWRHDGYHRGTTPQVGRIPGGQAYQLTVSDPPRSGTYAVDWGRLCRGAAAPGSCRPRSVQVGFSWTDPGYSWDRYRAEVETVVGTLRPLQANVPTAGDRSRSACRPDQWALVHPRAWAGAAGKPRLVVPVGVGFRGRQPCHLRASVSMAIEQDGRLLPVRGNPAPATIELDLPEDALPAGYRGVDDERILQLWTWDNPCSRQVGITDRTEMVFEDERGRRLLSLDIQLAGYPSETCPGSGGAPSVLAPWP
jgi:hypothetical protein